MKKYFKQKNGLNFNKRYIKTGDDDDADLQIISERYNDYCAVQKLIKWLRAEVMRSAELAFSNDREAFKVLRSRLLGLFGEAWGAEARLAEIYEQHQNGQARTTFETCKKGDAHD